MRIVDYNSKIEDMENVATTFKDDFCEKVDRYRKGELFSKPSTSRDATALLSMINMGQG